MLLRRNRLLLSTVLSVLLSFSLVLSAKADTTTWTQRYKKPATQDEARSLVVTSDGGFAIAGYSYSNGGDLWFVKTDSLGNMEWNQTYGGPDSDKAYSLVVTSDGGYAIAGYTVSFGAGGRDFWLVKVDAAGDMEWNQTYGWGGWDTAHSLVTTSDGGYALAGYTDSNCAGGCDYDFWLVKTDSLGNMEWNKTYEGGGNEYARSLVVTSDGGYAIAGSMSFNASSRDCWLIKTDAAGNVQWNQTYGGPWEEWADSLIQTSDGGYAMAGGADVNRPGGLDCWVAKTDAAGNLEWSKKYVEAQWGGTNSLVESPDGGYVIASTTYYGANFGEFWLFKVDEFGNVEWTRAIGGAGQDIACSLVATPDGGYAIAGYTYSNGAGSYDFFLVKTDAAGNVQWNQTYGGTEDDGAGSLVATPDGGFAIAGYTNSFGAGEQDFWLVKTDAFGNMEWNKTYGGTDDDVAISLVVTSDGGFAIAGYTNSFGAGEQDFWLVKTDEFGNMEWNQTYGDTGIEWVTSLVVTSDGGYALAGIWNFSSGTEFAIATDFWLVKTDSLGNMEWNRTYEGCVANSLVVTFDGGYALAGYTYSSGAGSRDCWLVKTDEFGNVESNWTYGGTGDDVAYSLVVTSDGGYALAGYTKSFGTGYGDVWLVKTDMAGNMQWNRTYGGIWEGDWKEARSLVVTPDGGFAIAGQTCSAYPFMTGDGNLFDFADFATDFCLVKTDAAGNMEWSQTYGGTGDDVAYSLVVTSDGGYALAGITFSFGAGEQDFWLVKTDKYGVTSLIPEASWVVLPLLLTATLFIFISKKKLLGKRRY